MVLKSLSCCAWGKVSMVAWSGLKVCVFVDDLLDENIVFRMFVFFCSISFCSTVSDMWL